MRYFYAFVTGAISGHLIAQIVERWRFPALLEPRQFLTVFALGALLTCGYSLLQGPDSRMVAGGGLVCNAAAWFVLCFVSIGLAGFVVKEGTRLVTPTTGLISLDVVFALDSLFYFLMAATTLVFRNILITAR